MHFFLNFIYFVFTFLILCSHSPKKIKKKLKIIKHSESWEKQKQELKQKQKHLMATPSTPATPANPPINNNLFLAEDEQLSQILFKKGLRFEENANMVAAIKMYYAAAELGHVTSHYYIGVSFAKGEGNAMDQKQAMEWYEKAFQFGSLRSAEALGCRYFTGSYNTKVNYPKAMTYLSLSLENNNDAMFTNYLLGIWLGLGDSTWQTEPDALKAWQLVLKIPKEQLASKSINMQYAAAQIANSLYWLQHESEPDKLSQPLVSVETVVGLLKNVIHHKDNDNKVEVNVFAASCIVSLLVFDTNYSFIHSTTNADLNFIMEHSKMSVLSVRIMFFLQIPGLNSIPETILELIASFLPRTRSIIEACDYYQMAVQIKKNMVVSDPQDCLAFVTLLKRAALMGSTSAQVDLGVYYGQIGEDQLFHSLPWELAAAKQGNPWGMENVFRCYACLNTEEGNDLARLWLDRIDNSKWDNRLNYPNYNQHNMQRVLLSAVLTGKYNFKIDPKHAVLILSQLESETNDVELQRLFAHVLECGFGDIPQNLAGAAKRYALVTTTNTPSGLYHLGELIFLYKLNFDKPKFLVKKTNDFNFNFYHDDTKEEGKENKEEKKEENKEEKKEEKKEKKKDTNCQESIKEQKSKAMKIWKRGAAKDCVFCCYRVGWALATGTFGLELNQKEAREWFEKAANLGHYPSKLHLDSLSVLKSLSTSSSRLLSLVKSEKLSCYFMAYDYSMETTEGFSTITLALQKYRKNYAITHGLDILNGTSFTWELEA
jgi:TPR repeat protein